MLTKSPEAVNVRLQFGLDRAEIFTDINVLEGAGSRFGVISGTSWWFQKFN
jgi:hypothetical protein